MLAGRVETGGELTYAELHRTGSYLSTSPHLEPLRALLDEHLGGDVRILGDEAGRFVPLPAGEVAFVDFSQPRGALQSRISLSGLANEGLLYHDTFRIDVFALPNELTTFTGTVNPLLALAGLAPIAAPPIALPPLEALRQVLDGFAVRLPGARAGVAGGVRSARWVAPDPAIEGAATEPVLEVLLELETGESIQPGLLAAIALRIPSIQLAIRIQPTVCALPGAAGTPCVLGAARNGMFDAYDGHGGDAAADDTNVDLAIRLGGTSMPGGVWGVALPGCPLVPGLSPALCVALDQILAEAQGLVEGPLARGAGNAVVGLLAALSNGLPNVTFFLPMGPVDVGQLPFAVSGTDVAPAFTAPFGALGGQWGVTSMVGVARGGTLCPAAGVDGCPAAVPGVVPLVVTGTPSLAPIVSSAPFVANESRALFTAPVLSRVRAPAPSRGIPPRDTVGTFARYTAIAPSVEPSTGEVTASFSFVLDLDGDGVRDYDDTCIDVTNVGIDDDADTLDDACDTCVGVPSLNRRDGDGDGEGDVCDCDADGDSCIDRFTHPITELSCGAGTVLDRSPVPATGDADEDGIPDDCDPDSDEDGVLDEVDNCRLVANPDQRDSGGLDSGDACDPLCPDPGAPGCAFDPRRSGFAGGGFRSFDFIPGGMEAICRASRDACFDLWSIRRCFAGGPGCDDVLVAHSPRALDIEESLLTTDRVDAVQSLARTTDLDGDGITEMAVGLPFTARCEAPGACDPRAGEVVVLGSRDGQVLVRLDGPARGARLGQATVAFGHYLAVGAPGMRNGHGQRAGAVFVYHLGYDPPRLVGSFYGQDRKDKLGRALSLAADRDGDGLPELLVAVPGARGRAGREAGRVEARTFTGRVLQTFEGPTARARLGDDSSVLLSRQQSPEGVMVGASREGRGGAVVFFGWDGRQRWVVRGPRGAALGASLAPAADFDGDGRFEVAVGAPGARRDDGAVWMLDPSGRLLSELVVPGARRLGEHVGVPGDIDGDGQAELGVSFRHGAEDAQSTLLLRRAGQSSPNDLPQ